MQYATAKDIDRIAAKLLRIVGKLPREHVARATFFRIAGSPRGIVSPEHVNDILATILAK